MVVFQAVFQGRMEEAVGSFVSVLIFGLGFVMICSPEGL